jgi:allantoinase
VNASLPIFALRSRRVVTPAGVREATIVIEGGKIAKVLPSDATLRDIPLEDLGNLVLSPGVIDAHVHVNEPGRTDWEGFETATRAAAAGGVTTIVDMPLNSSPVTTTPAALTEKQTAATGKCWVDVGLYGGLVPGNAQQMAPLCDAGVLGIKAFLCHSGLDEFPNATQRDLREAMPILTQQDLPLLVHAELIESAAPTMTDVRSYSQYVASRPVRWEIAAIELMIRLCREYRCRVHIVHLATGEALPMLASAKREGLPITVETCPHYLFFGDSEIADGDTRFKCAPPIRRGASAALWQGLVDGTLDTVGSDHSPCPPAMKALDSGDFTKAWGGISSLQLTLSTLWTFSVKQGCTDVSQPARWLSAAPAKLVGLDGRKGKIAQGYDADLIVWDPQAAWRVAGSELFHRHKVTPYDGLALQGRVQRTYLRGNLIFAEGAHLGHPSGQLLSHPHSKGAG